MSSWKQCAPAVITTMALWQLMYLGTWCIVTHCWYQWTNIPHMQIYKGHNSCMQNMSKIYKGHNSKITSALCNQLTLCNCQDKGECAIDGKCQTMDAVYNCRVTSSEPQKVYFGLAEGKWKQKYYNHKKSFNHKRYSHETTLSSYVWHLKKTLDITPNLKWSIVRCTTPYSNISKKCLLCLHEKLVIITYSRQHELSSKRSGLFLKCRHENKYLLENFIAYDKG